MVSNVDKSTSYWHVCWYIRLGDDPLITLMYFRLAERGHEVVGVEYAKAAVTKFFEHNNLPFSVHQHGKLNVYKVGQ